MKIKIEEYRGWAINFDTEKEIFYAESNEHDTETKKNSYAAAKKFVDDFIKDNINFKPFVAISLPNTYGSRKKINIVGIRKDKSFVFDENGAISKLGIYDEKNYVVYTPEYEPLLKQYAEAEAEIEALRIKKNKIFDAIQPVTLNEIKDKYTL